MTNFESWGRYPKVHQRCEQLFWATDFTGAIPQQGSMLAVGMGRSYGDVCLNENNTVVCARGMDRLLSFDAERGILRCEAGVTLAEILDFSVPRGWFLPVTPGTKYVTVGGAIANDVHGKNHHVAGTFGRHVRAFELLRSDRATIRCSASENRDWYAATIGGLGLTGMISRAEIQLKPVASRGIAYQGIKFRGLAEFMELSREYAAREYTVAWVDCAAQGSNFARGIFMAGEHCGDGQPRRAAHRRKFMLPFDWPGFVLNRYTVRLFNALYYHKQTRKRVTATVDYEPFFYPLDAVLQWNRMYGKNGLLQFQCAVPHAAGMETVTQILRVIAQSGLASFLAVLKVCGDIPSPGMMSFPLPGITLALDFPIKGEKSFRLVERLGQMAAEAGGRLYPAKDARMPGEQFRRFYPQWQRFAAYIDAKFSSSFWRRVTES